MKKKKQLLSMQLSAQLVSSVAKILPSNACVPGSLPTGSQSRLSVGNEIIDEVCPDVHAPLVAICVRLQSYRQTDNFQTSTGKEKRGRETRKVMIERFIFPHRISVFRQNVL